MTAGVRKVITPAMAKRELKRRGRIGGKKNTSKEAIVVANRDGTFALSNAELERIAAAQPGPGRATTTNEARSSGRAKGQPTTVRLPEPYAWQSEALQAWRSAGSRGVIEAVTGAGKSLLGLITTAETIKAGRSVALLVPSVPLQDQWVASIRASLPGLRVARLGGESSPERSMRDADVLVAIVDSARNQGLRVVERPGLLIADEVHRYGSEHNATALREAFPNRLGLTATYERPDEGIEKLLEPYFGAICYRLGYKRAIADGVLAPFRAALLPVVFSPSEQHQYAELSRQLADTASELQTYLGFSEPFNKFMKEVQLLTEGDNPMTWVARRYTSVMAQRRALLAETGARTAAFEELIPVIEASGQALVFGERISQSVDLAKRLRRHGISAQAIHSNLDRDERKKALDDFAAGTTKVVTAPKVLDEGVDVPEADLAVVVATTRSRRQMIQRMGRVIRRKADGRHARFALIFVEDTTEDPARGAHDLFLEEVTAASDQIRQFEPGWRGGEVVEWFAGDLSQAGTSAPTTRPPITDRNDGTGRKPPDKAPKERQPDPEREQRSRDRRVARIAESITEDDVRKWRKAYPDARDREARPIANEPLARRLGIPFHDLIAWFKAEETVDKLQRNKKSAAPTRKRKTRPTPKKPDRTAAVQQAADNVRSHARAVDDLMRVFDASRPSAKKKTRRQLRSALPELIRRYGRPAVEHELGQSVSAAQLQSRLAKRFEPRPSPGKRAAKPRQKALSTKAKTTPKKRRPKQVQETGPGLTPTGKVYRCSSCGQSITVTGRCACS